MYQGNLEMGNKLRWTDTSHLVVWSTNSLTGSVKLRDSLLQLGTTRSKINL